MTSTSSGRANASGSRMGSVMHSCIVVVERGTLNSGGALEDSSVEFEVKRGHSSAKLDKTQAEKPGRLSRFPASPHRFRLEACQPACCI
jgi:hypothetical protein